MSALLQGCRVIESATLLNGDRLGDLLGDLGADVIKLESPFQGDYLRDILGQITPHHSPAHIQVNKNKRSLTLDLRRAEGKEIFWRLLATADVFVDGNMADACVRLGIGYEDQRARKPDIIYCQYTGYGATEPYARIPTHGQLMNAAAGAMPVALGEDGFVHVVPPAEVEGMRGTSNGGEGTATGAIYAAFHVAAALHHRQRTGQGCYLDAAASDAVIANAWITATYDLNDHRITDRTAMPGPSTSMGAKYQFYETGDGKFVLFAAIEHKFWDKFCRAVGREDLIERKDLRAPVDFRRGDQELRAELRTIFRQRDRAQWLKLAAERDLPIGPAHTRVAELRDDPQLAQREIFWEGEHPHAGPFTYVGQPVVVRGQPYCVRRPAPRLGEHSAEILRELGCAERDIERWHAARII
jgi:crotonobetainyl-CoA:carnitine CoA-transferase CaiB-like acyl-CoA transferase